MNLTFKNKRISGLLTVVPAREQSFIDEMKEFNFPEARSLKLKEVMGYDKHRLVDPSVCVSDLAIFGLQHLFDTGKICKDEIDALILVTQSPDYIMPPTSNIIQGQLNLKQDMFCLDINQGCAGYIIGLMQAFMLLDQASIQKVVLINADVLSRKTSPKDRNSFPLIGDAASITLIERDSKESTISANIKMDGTRSNALMIPAGGMRMPSSPQTAILEDVGEKNLRAKDHLRMDGSAVFNFVQMEVPPMIESLLSYSGVQKGAVDYFFFHQPNRFMLQKLADKMKVPHDRMPMNVVEHFGNSSGVTIPTAITFNFSHRLEDESFLACFAGFGVGLTWGSMLMNFGKLNFCKIINFP